jgi:uncharacterized membrane protein YtjA (UPF0391 family)
MAPTGVGMTIAVSDNIARRGASRRPLPEENAMLYWALVFLVVALIAGLLGFTTVAGASIAIAKFLAALFLIVFVVLLIMGLSARRV